MAKDKIEGSVAQARGTIKQAVGKLTGDAKLQAEGVTEKASGKLQNALGSVRDAARDALKE